MTIEKINQLADVPFEQWPNHGIKLTAVSANANGIVNSGILANGQYFYRKWECKYSSAGVPHFTGKSEFVKG
jgi:hypothetical protein